MQRIVIATLIMFTLSPAYAQNDLLDRITKQAVELDSLKKVVKAEMDNNQHQRNVNQNLQDTLRNLRSDLATLKEFKTEKKNIDNLVRQKTDSIIYLGNEISEKEKQITKERQKSEQQAREENEKGKNEILITIINIYKNKPFDELLQSSTIQSAQRDLMLVESPADVRQIILDIDKYLIAKGLLDSKLDAIQIKDVQKQLDQIKPQSALGNKIKEKIGNYQTFNDGLKETIGKIMALDNAETVSGMSKEIQKKKFDKILAKVSSYIFNYDFNFSDYPYLSDIFLEIIKRKQPNPDADISDLLKKL